MATWIPKTSVTMKIKLEVPMENVVKFAWALSSVRGILNWHYQNVEADDTINNVNIFWPPIFDEGNFCQPDYYIAVTSSMHSKCDCHYYKNSIITIMNFIFGV
jgi:hypothetical protein